MVRFFLILSLFGLLMYILGCATTQKCKQLLHVTSVECNKVSTTCIIHFDDNSIFYLPKGLADTLDKSEPICVK